MNSERWSWCGHLSSITQPTLPASGHCRSKSHELGPPFHFLIKENIKHQHVYKSVHSCSKLATPRIGREDSSLEERRSCAERDKVGFVLVIGGWCVQQGYLSRGCVLNNDVLLPLNSTEHRAVLLIFSYFQMFSTNYVERAQGREGCAEILFRPSWPLNFCALPQKYAEQCKSN